MQLASDNEFKRDNKRLVPRFIYAVMGNSSKITIGLVVLVNFDGVNVVFRIPTMLLFAQIVRSSEETIASSVAKTVLSKKCNWNHYWQFGRGVGREVDCCKLDLIQKSARR